MSGLRRIAKPLIVLAALAAAGCSSDVQPTANSDDPVAEAGKGNAGGGTGGTAGAGKAAKTGSLAVVVTGLPAGTNAAITVTGPKGFSRAVGSSTTIGSLPTGTYTVTAAGVSAGGKVYTPTPASRSVSVTAGGTVTATVTYAVGIGKMALTVNGLPTGAAGLVTVTGPNGYSQTFTGTRSIDSLTPGSYSVTAATVTANGVSYDPTPKTQTVSVPTGGTGSAAVGYVGKGSLVVTVNGLPTGAAASIAIAGPNGYTGSATGSTTIGSLTAGDYTLTASSIVSGGVTYVPSPTTSTAAVPSGGSATATIGYQVQSAATLNLQVAGFYLTQATAKFDGSTKLVAGRNAYLRVFVTANQANTAQPTVRARFYSGTTLVQTSTLTGPAAGVPTAVNEGVLASSWNLPVAGSLVQPNLKVVVDVDPSNGIAESNEGDNVFPAGGSPRAVDVRAVPTFNVRFVPVRQSVNGLEGSVNVSGLMDLPLKMLPIQSYATSVRATYTTNAPVLQSGNGNSAWGTVLNEILALKNAEASNLYYYGVVKTSYTSGIAGMGYVGGTYHTSIGWDWLPSGSKIMAHEVGHNMGRWHSPCGGAGSQDASYPYAGGGIGVWGLDLATLQLKSPSVPDFMGYCNNDWVSDYSWNGLINYRTSGATNAPPAAPANAVAGLLVWGRITHDGIVLEPSMRVAPPATMPTGSGEYRIEGLSIDGRVLFSYPVDPQHTMTHQSAHEEHFAAVLPMDQVQDAALSRVRLITPNGPVERVSAQAVQRTTLFRDPGARVGAPNAVQASFSWDGATYPMAMIRDAATGEILSFARGGSTTVWTSSRRFDVTFSDGVRSLVRRIQ